jgi:hypothetical protein
MVEGGAKQYQARLCGPGMRGSRAGAEHIIPVRTAILSGRFSDVWRQVYNSPPPCDAPVRALEDALIATP